MDQMEGLNPRAFQLPKDIRETFEFIFTHPKTGRFMDIRDVVVAPSLPRGKVAVTRSKGSSLTKGHTQDTPKPAENSNLNCYCHKCSKSALAISGTSFLASHTVPDKFPILQAQKSELIKCDYCPLHWHLDCLSPPLASIPHQLLPEENEWIDRGDITMLQAQLWSGKCPLNPRLKFNPQVPKVESVLSCQDLYALDGAAIGSPMLATYRYLTIREKWMCPCHADWVTPKLRPRTHRAIFEMPERPVTWMGTHDDILNQSRKVPRFRIVLSNPSGELAIPTVTEQGTNSSKHLTELPKNNGHIEIQNCQATLDFYDQIKYVVPERRVEYEFFSKVKDQLDKVDFTLEPQLQQKLAEFDAHYHSKLEDVRLPAVDREHMERTVTSLLSQHTDLDSASRNVLLFLI